MKVLTIAKISKMSLTACRKIFYANRINSAHEAHVNIDKIKKKNKK